MSWQNKNKNICKIPSQKFSIHWKTDRLDAIKCNKFYNWLFFTTSNEIIWPEKILIFMHRLKSAISAFLKNCQNGTFLPMHEIFFLPNDFIWRVKEYSIIKFIHKVPLAPSKRLFIWIKMNKYDYFKINMGNFKNSFYFGIV